MAFLYFGLVHTKKRILPPSETSSKENQSRVLHFHILSIQVCSPPAWEKTPMITSIATGDLNISLGSFISRSTEPSPAQYTPLRYETHILKIAIPVTIGNQIKAL